MRESIASQFTLESKVAVVTGAASGIGRGIALLLAEAGATIVGVDLNEAGLAETVGQIQSAGAQAIARRVDVSSRDQVEELADFVTSALGKIDIWVNAAGIIVLKSVVDATPDDVERMLGVNMTGLYWCCAAAGRRMAAQKSGAIVNLSSSGADAPAPGLSLYSMTKAAVNMLTRTAAAELGASGVRVNAVAPGFVDTPLVTYRFRDAEGNIDPVAHAALLESRIKGTPLGVIATPQDIAFGVLYLASDAARTVTGQILRINGGVSMP